jgi:hypothetical protein
MILGWLALWVVVATLGNLFRYDRDDAFGLLDIAGRFVLWSAFAAILIASVWRAIKRRGEGMSVLMILAVASAGMVFLLDGRPLALRFRFLVHKGRYEAAVREILAGRAPRGDTDRYTVDPGPPVRVAFHWPGGILDNWNGVVYDPTGLVLKARLLRSDLSNLHAPEFREFVGLFDGNLCYCEPLGGDWYFCGFT